MTTEEEGRIWYSNALEVLGPLRWHLHELTQDMESWNRAAKRANLPMLPEHKIAAAKEAMDKANDFFAGNTKEHDPLEYPEWCTCDYTRQDKPRVHRVDCGCLCQICGCINCEHKKII